MSQFICPPFRILFWLRLSNLDPSSAAFKKAFAEALNENNSQAGGAPKVPRKGTSPWPVLAFLSFIFTAPYLIMKLLGTVTNTAQEEGTLIYLIEWVLCSGHVL